MNPIIVALLQRLVVVAVRLTLSGCYYMQAARGQMEVSRKREPIAEVVVGGVDARELAAQLQVVNEARQFSIDELRLAR